MTSKPAASARRAIASYCSTDLSDWRPRPTSKRAQVRSSVAEDALADPLDAHHDALFGVGAADEVVLLEPVLLGSRRCFAGSSGSTDCSA